MRSTRVITRFLSLLDVVLLLLGVLMITLMHAQLRSTNGPSVSEDPLARAADFVCVYAGWEGEKNGKCFLVKPDFRIGEELRTDRPDDIKRIVAARAKKTAKANQIVLLLFDANGWYSLWDRQKIEKIERAWETRLVPVYNVRLSGEQERTHD